MRRSTLFWGVILILIGGVLMLDNLGLLGNVNAWTLIWPVFLIGLGLWLMAGVFFRGRTESEHANVPLEGAASARVRLNHGAGRLRVYSGASAGDLAVGDFTNGVDIKSHREGSLLDVSLSVPVQVFPFFPWTGSAFDWSIGFNRDVPLALNFNTGAGESDLDLTELRVSELRLQTGASSTEIRLPANAGYTRVSVQSGAAAVNLRIPNGVAARIRTKAGLAAITVDSHRFPGNQSPDYDTAANKVEIDVETGVGSVDIR